MHVGGRQQAKTAVMVLGVVPREEDVAVGPGVLDRAEPVRERRSVLQRLELRFGERVVVAATSAAERHRATLVKLIAELQAVSDALKLPLSPAERGTLRLRADLASRLIVAHEKLAKLPPDAHEQGEGLVERALREDREARQKAEARRQRAPRARRGAVRPVGLQKPPEPSPQA